MLASFFYCLGSITEKTIYRHPESLEDVEDDDDEPLLPLPFVNGS